MHFFSRGRNAFITEFEGVFVRNQGRAHLPTELRNLIAGTTGRARMDRWIYSGVE
jgi:hypothetical protein